MGKGTKDADDALVKVRAQVTNDPGPQGQAVVDLQEAVRSLAERVAELERRGGI
jgi:hypothetical protein